MYTVVLMAAMTAGEASPQWLGHGCSSSCSCYSVCHGCHSWCGGHHGGWGCCGCGGMYGGTPFMGMCAGSHWDGYACYGAYGCMGGGYCGGGCYGGGGGCYTGCGGCACVGYCAGWPGAYGSCYGYGGGLGGNSSFTCGGNYGCYGGYSCYGMPSPSSEVVVPTAPATTPAPVPMTPPPAIAPPPPPKASLEKVRSKVIIDTPENAKLYVDGQLMQTASTHRVFQTPELAPGATYFYDLKVETVQNGKTQTEERRIYVRPGVEATVAFTGTQRSDIATVSNTRD